jgi:ketosteroid isomerase-like protein
MSIAFLSVALLAGSDSTPAALKAREAAVAASSARAGLPAALASVLAPDAVIVFPAAPVVIGKDRIVRLLAAQPGLDSLQVEWTDVETWLARDGTMAATIGRSTIGPRTGGAGRPGTYIVTWTKSGGEWWIGGLVMTALVAPGSVVLPDGIGATSLGPAVPSGPAGRFIRADLDFAALAGKSGAPDAFRAFAAPNAIVQAGPATRRGPDEIAAGIADGAPADWEWYPVLGRAAGSGDLGFTVGQSTIKPKAGGAANLGKYLTVWTRRPDGSARYLTDGGNPRPTP